MVCAVLLGALVILITSEVTALLVSLPPPFHEVKCLVRGTLTFCDDDDAQADDQFVASIEEAVDGVYDALNASGVKLIREEGSGKWTEDELAYWVGVVSGFFNQAVRRLRAETRAEYQRGNVSCHMYTLTYASPWWLPRGSA